MKKKKWRCHLVVDTWVVDSPGGSWRIRFTNWERAVRFATARVPISVAIKALGSD